MYSIECLVDVVSENVRTVLNQRRRELVVRAIREELFPFVTQEMVIYEFNPAVLERDCNTVLMLYLC
jgi:hypothetical protein